MMKLNTRLSSVWVALLAVLSLARADEPSTHHHHAAIFGFAASIPHVVPWGSNSDQFEFHDANRYVLVQSPDYADGDGLDIQIQTTVKDFYSYIDAAVLRVGSVTVEVRGGPDGKGRVWVNGDEQRHSTGDDDVIRLSLAGLESATFRQINSKQFVFTADLGHGDVVKFETFQDFIRVDMDARNDHTAFAGSFGLMGSFPEGIRIARDQSTILKSSRSLVKEWRVLETEEDLFHSEEQRHVANTVAA